MEDLNKKVKKEGNNYKPNTLSREISENDRIVYGTEEGD